VPSGQPSASTTSSKRKAGNSPVNIPPGYRLMGPDEVMVTERDYFWPGGPFNPGSVSLKDWMIVYGYGGAPVSSLTSKIAITPITNAVAEKEWVDPWD
jgi:hypothetical protein